MFRFRFASSSRNEAPERLLAAVAEAARWPELFAEGRIPDTLDGRFEALTLFASEALYRLRAERGAEPLAQSFVDVLFRYLDAGLRESGVGDLTVPKKMKALAQAFYGRAAAYSAAEDEDALAQALSRNVWNAETAPFAPALARHALAVRAALADSHVEALASIETWPAFRA